MPGDKQCRGSFQHLPDGIHCTFEICIVRHIGIWNTLIRYNIPKEQTSIIDYFYYNVMISMRGSGIIDA